MHLIRRFFGFLRAEPLTPTEQRHVSELLADRLARAFFAQRIEDQRHAYDVQQKVADHPELTEAALLHDIGKIESGLGAIGRSLATMFHSLGLPMLRSWKTYVDHGRIGAERLQLLNAGAFAVEFTRWHPGTPPPGVDHEAWHLLEAADNA